MSLDKGRIIGLAAWKVGSMYVSGNVQCRELLRWDANHRLKASKHLIWVYSSHRQTQLAQSLVSLSSSRGFRFEATLTLLQYTSHHRTPRISGSTLKDPRNPCPKHETRNVRNGLPTEVTVASSYNFKNTWITSSHDLSITCMDAVNPILDAGLRSYLCRRSWEPLT